MHSLNRPRWQNYNNNTNNNFMCTLNLIIVYSVLQKNASIDVMLQWYSDIIDQYCVHK